VTRIRGRQAIVQRANQIKLTRRRFLGRRTPPTRLFNMRQIDQAVFLIRQRGNEKDRQLLRDAGYRA
jgi:hypothetical protein